METKRTSTHLIDRVAITATTWVGSVPSIVTHTIIFIFFIALILLGVDEERVLLILTTLVSLEAIYLSIFIQMSVNRQAESLAEVEEDIDEIQEDIDDISEDIDDISEDIDDISVDIDDMSDEEKKDIDHTKTTQVALDKIQLHIQQLLAEVDRFKNASK